MSFIIANGCVEFFWLFVWKYSIIKAKNWMKNIGIQLFYNSEDKNSTQTGQKFKLIGSMKCFLFFG